MRYPAKKMSPLEVLFSFEGRLGRLDFWLYSLIPIGIMTAGFLLLITIDDSGRYLPYRNPSVMTMVVFTIIMIVAIWISLAIQAKRWHDIDRSAWWILINFVPYAYLVLFVVLGFIKGTEGPNRFGPDPLQKDPAPHRPFVEEAVVQAAPVIDRPQAHIPRQVGRSVTLLGMGHNAPPIVLEEGMEVTVGRSRQASVVLNDRFISSLHLALRLDTNGQVSVRDLGSTNGTFLQGKRLQPNRSYPLHPGERLAIGSENVIYTL